ncbi:MAG: RNA-directed DNA polymerase [Bacteroidetes bacterium]|nr:MAG: RNA-directed DNA polymerase [Bacteroidota bacterium]TAG90117.1 MAG: RNA-directed DNA polymerase [Bacteroidota bacterium]
MTNYDKMQEIRQEVAMLGKEYYIMREMLRTGFLKMSEADLATMKANLGELTKINQELNELSKELKDIPDITPIIAEIRKNRIEKVKTERLIKRVEKEKLLAQRKERLAQKKKNTPQYLGDIAKGLKFQNQNEEKLKEKNLPLLKDLQDLSTLSQLTREQLQWLSYHRKTAKIDHYTRFQIPKRTGGLRTIASPKPKLRVAQQWILENILAKLSIHEAAMAFNVGASVVKNATPHLNSEVVIKIDVKDFFPSIKFNRVVGFFKSLGYSQGISSILGLLCTDSMRLNVSFEGEKFFVAIGERYLPQGACTSPMLTNLICKKLDARLSKLAEKYGFAYTRYADDMTFSHKQKDANIKAVLGWTKKILAEENFELKKEKTSVMRKYQRQTVTGVLVNHEETKISRKDIKKFRAFLHQYTLIGAEKMSEKLGKDATAYGKGYFSYLKMVNKTQAEKFKQTYSWLG